MAFGGKFSARKKRNFHVFGRRTGDAERKVDENAMKHKAKSNALLLFSQLSSVKQHVLERALKRLYKMNGKKGRSCTFCERELLLRHWLATAVIRHAMSYFEMSPDISTDYFEAILPEFKEKLVKKHSCIRFFRPCIERRFSSEYTLFPRVSGAFHPFNCSRNQFFERSLSLPSSRLLLRFAQRRRNSPYGWSGYRSARKRCDYCLGVHFS